MFNLKKEAVNKLRTDITRGQTMIYKTLHTKLNIE